MYKIARYNKSFLKTTKYKLRLVEFYFQKLGVMNSNKISYIFKD